jgi:hypothetical protein
MYLRNFVRIGDKQSVNYLLRNGCIVNYIYPDTGITVLCDAVKNLDYEMCALLCFYGADKKLCNPLLHMPKYSSGTSAQIYDLLAPATKVVNMDIEMIDSEPVSSMMQD